MVRQRFQPWYLAPRLRPTELVWALNVSVGQMDKLNRKTLQQSKLGRSIKKEMRHFSQFELGMHKDLIDLATLLCDWNMSVGKSRELPENEFSKRLNKVLKKFDVEYLDWEGGRRLQLVIRRRSSPKLRGSSRVLMTREASYIWDLARLVESGLRYRLRRCPECSKFLFAAHAARKYCSRRCSMLRAGRKHAQTPRRKKYMRDLMRRRYLEKTTGV